MKIFITIPWYLPAFRAGGPIRSIANLVSEYPEAEYYIFCGDTDINGAALEGIERGKWMEQHGAMVWYAKPDMSSYSLTSQVEEIKPDVLFMVGLYSWHYTLVPLIFCKSVKKIISVRGMLHPGALATKKWKKKLFLQLFKSFNYPKKVAFHATDVTEANYIKEVFGDSAKVYVAGNFPTPGQKLPLPLKEEGHLRLLSVGLVTPMKNILKVLEALANVGAHIEYTIIGAIRDEAYWDVCREKIRTLNENIKVICPGEMPPDEIKEAIRTTHVFVLPSRSENFGHAIFEALSSGRPVITSHHTPWKGLKEHKAGINVSLDGIKELTAAIDFFAGLDNVEMEEWSAGAAEYAAQQIDKKKLREEYRIMFRPDLQQD